MGEPAPLEIEKLGERALRILWSDAHASVYPFPELRFACSCAGCVDEWTGVRSIREADVPADIHPTGLQLVGNYAMQLDWSDGHSTGIYTWDALRALCPCAACAGGRAGGS